MMLRECLFNCTKERTYRFAIDIGGLFLYSYTHEDIVSTYKNKLYFYISDNWKKKIQKISRKNS